MTHRLAVVAVAVVTLLLTPAGHAAATDLQLVASQTLSPRLTELTFRTAALSAATKVRILVPDGYHEQPDRRWPVLWLLHGGFGSFRSWTQDGAAEQITADARFIVVMPDTGPDGGYTDWHNFGRGGPPKWETYHLTQLLPWVDEHLRTMPERGARAVAGLSMGGGGAMTYAARQPDLFVSATSLSGAVDTNSLLVQPLTSVSGFSQGRPGAVYGDRLTEEVRWRGRNPWDLAPNLGGLDLTVRTGNGLPGGPGGDLGDPIELEVHNQGVTFHRRLQELGIPHVWDDYGPGGHGWWYWQRGLRQLVGHLERIFADPPPPPARVTHREIEPVYEAYGWQVQVWRPVLEFSELRDADRRGFSLLGSGSAQVSTPPWYRPGEPVRVTIRRGAGTSQLLLWPDASCRLHVPVVLGQGNRFQQHTLLARLLGHRTFATHVQIEPAAPCG